MLTWVIDNYMFNPKSIEKMVEHCKTNRIPYRLVQIGPQGVGIIEKTSKIEGPVIMYGPIGCEQIAKENNWIPGVFSSPDFNCRKYKEVLGKDFLNWDMQFMKLSEVSHHLAMFPETIFLRPVADTKDFAGIVLDYSEFDTWYTQMVGSGYLDSTTDIEVGLAAATKILAEWRNVVVINDVVSTSLYQLEGRKVERQENNREVTNLISKYVMKFQPAFAYIVDVALTPDGYKIIEYNTFNHAGMYDGNIPAIMNAMEYWNNTDSKTLESCRVRT